MSVLKIFVFLGGKWYEILFSNESVSAVIVNLPLFRRHLQTASEYIALFVCERWEQDAFSSDLDTRLLNLWRAWGGLFRLGIKNPMVRIDKRQ
jgi:hypothetical protein